MVSPPHCPRRGALGLVGMPLVFESGGIRQGGVDLELMADGSFVGDIAFLGDFPFSFGGTAADIETLRTAFEDPWGGPPPFGRAHQGGAQGLLRRLEGC